MPRHLNPLTLTRVHNRTVSAFQKVLATLAQCGPEMKDVSIDVYERLSPDELEFIDDSTCYTLVAVTSRLRDYTLTFVRVKTSPIPFDLFGVFRKDKIDIKITAS